MISVATVTFQYEFLLISLSFFILNYLIGFNFGLNTFQIDMSSSNCGLLSWTNSSGTKHALTEQLGSSEIDIMLVARYIPCVQLIRKLNYSFCGTLDILLNNVTLT